jgi:hypothetical protein
MYNVTEDQYQAIVAEDETTTGDDELDSTEYESGIGYVYTGRSDEEKRLDRLVCEIQSIRRNIDYLLGVAIAFALTFAYHYYW